MCNYYFFVGILILMTVHFEIKRERKRTKERKKDRKRKKDLVFMGFH